MIFWVTLATRTRCSPNSSGLHRSDLEQELFLSFHFLENQSSMRNSVYERIASLRLSIVSTVIVGLMFLLSIYAQPQEITATVIFFKENKPQLSRFKRTYAWHRDKWMIYMDDRQLLELHYDRIAGFIVPAGLHAFRTGKSKPLSIHLSPGDIVFLRPMPKPKNDELAQQTPLAVVNCSFFVKQVIHIKRVESKDIFSGETTKVPFAQACYRPR